MAYTMKQVTAEITDSLRERGYRITKARVAVIDAFATQTKPHTITEYVEHVSVDEATVYRTIELLLEEGFIERIVANGETLFALGHGHHHHLICTNCDHIEHLPCQTPGLTLTQHPFAQVTSHEVTFYGLCKQCEG